MRSALCSVVIAGLVGGCGSSGPKMVESLHCTNGTDYCSCSGTSSDTKLDTTSCEADPSTDGICCASSDWPAHGSSCECDANPVGCMVYSSDFCICSDTDGPGSSCPAPTTAMTCCIAEHPTGVTPYCGCQTATGCDTANGEVAVPSCDAARVRAVYGSLCSHISDLEPVLVGFCSQSGTAGAPSGGTTGGGTTGGSMVSCYRPSCTSSGTTGCNCTATADKCLASDVDQSVGGCDAAQQKTQAGDKYARCCADDGYPATGGCRCWPWRCEARSAGTYSCVCGTAITYTDDLSSCTDSLCCQNTSGGQCTCSPTQTSCASGYTEVTDCSFDSCPDGSSAVDACDDILPG